MAWRWQQRYFDEGVSGPKRDKTWPSRVPPLPREIGLKVMGKAMQGAAQCQPLALLTDS